MGNSATPQIILCSHLCSNCGALGLGPGPKMAARPGLGPRAAAIFGPGPGPCAPKCEHECGNNIMMWGSSYYCHMFCHMMFTFRVT